MQLNKGKKVKKKKKGIWSPIATESMLYSPGSCALLLIL